MTKLSTNAFQSCILAIPLTAAIFAGCKTESPTASPQRFTNPTGVEVVGTAYATDGPLYGKDNLGKLYAYYDVWPKGAVANNSNTDYDDMFLNIAFYTNGTFLKSYSVNVVNDLSGDYEMPAGALGHFEDTRKARVDTADFDNLSATVEVKATIY
jgi:hypothetical protein